MVGLANKPRLLLLHYLDAAEQIGINFVLIKSSASAAVLGGILYLVSSLLVKCEQSRCCRCLGQRSEGKRLWRGGPRSARRLKLQGRRPAPLNEKPKLEQRSPSVMELNYALNLITALQTREKEIESDAMWL